MHIEDRDGNRLLDGFAGLYCVNVGYGQEALIDAAVQQMRALPFYNAFFQTTTPPAIALAERLASLTPPQFSHVFFATS